MLFVDRIKSAFQEGYKINERAYYSFVHESKKKSLIVACDPTFVGCKNRTPFDNQLFTSKYFLLSS